MPLHLKAGDEDLPLITEPALLTRCALGLGDVYKIGIGRCLQWNIGMDDDMHDDESVFRKTRETHNDC